ncbi:sensor histidine kinase [Microbispora siamensis]
MNLARWAPLNRRARVEIRYVLAALPLSVLGFLYAAVATAGGSYLAITLLGLPLLALVVTGARGLGRAHRWLAVRLLGVAVPPAERLRRDPGFFGWIRSGLGDVVGWRSMAYLLLKGPLGLLAALTALGTWAWGLVLGTYPFWWWAARSDSTDSAGRVHHSALQIGDFFFDSWPRAFLPAVLGAGLLVLSPWAVHAVLRLDVALLRVLLGPTGTSQRIRHLEETRAHAVEASDERLRRIERDLHDGAQVRLVTLAMHLGAAKDRLARLPEPDATLTRLVGEAHENAKAALGELRDLVRGIHPPILDNGLDAALSTLAATAAVPVRVRAAVPRRPSPAIESIAYFCAAELLANAAKHSHATRAEVSAACDGDLLRLVVRDDGTGGVEIRPGGGLAGLAERLGPVDGRLLIHSPAGGPTVITVELPLHV